MNYGDLELNNESDVEQKLLWPLLTAGNPDGLGYTSVDIKTKPSIRQFPIGKGNSGKLYFPDYVVVLAGLPVLVVEAKAPGENLQKALNEGRLYANELNALYEHGINPCTRVISSDGIALLWTRNDSNTPIGSISATDMDASDANFASIVDLMNRSTVQSEVEEIQRKRTRPCTYQRPASLVGGRPFQNEELPQNTFGATVAGDYGHIFNPKSMQNRRLIAEKAYISSTRRQRYVEPIDRMIRNAVAPGVRDIGVIGDTSKPKEIISKFENPGKLVNQLLLVVGSVGAGKSTFVDHLSEVALPLEMRERSLWIRVDLNEAPLDDSRVYKWLDTAVIQGIKEAFPDTDFDDYEFLNKVFSRELNKLRKLLTLLDSESEGYRTRIVDRLIELSTDERLLSKGLADYFSTAGNRLLIITLDNCDKRTADEQLKMFQVAEWVRSEFSCLVILPIRDVTFDLYRNTPPLDTVVKQYVFRIEPPAFSDVLQARVRLALSEYRSEDRASTQHSYDLPNGMSVPYASKDKALYLSSMVRSLYAHDRLVRQIMTGLAGRDVRKALEIFLEFCKSGHIGEDQIFFIRQTTGKHELPLEIVTRVLLRINRRFYSGDNSYLKNLLQCDPNDASPDHFARVSLLRWFDSKKTLLGPAKVEGFHRGSDAISALTSLGHDAARVREEIHYLIRERCLIPEHLQLDDLDDGDLVKISSSGVVHLQLLANPEYVAACAEDTWLSNNELTSEIADLIAGDQHFNKATTLSLVEKFYSYLEQEDENRLAPGRNFLEEADYELREKQFIELAAARDAIYSSISDELYVSNIPHSISHTELVSTFKGAGIEKFKIRLPRGRNGVQNRGFGFLEVSSSQNLRTLLNMPPIKIGKQVIRIEFSEPNSHSRSGHRSTSTATAATPSSEEVFVTQLPSSYSEQDIRSLLAAEDISALKISVKANKNGVSKGFGFVELRNSDDASRVISALNGLQVGNKKLVAAPATGRRDNRRGRKKN